MQPIVGAAIYQLADNKGKELTNQEILEAFKNEFVNVSKSFFLEKYELLHNDLNDGQVCCCLLYTSPSPRDATLSRMPSSA